MYSSHTDTALEADNLRMRCAHCANARCKVCDNPCQYTIPDKFKLRGFLNVYFAEPLIIISRVLYYKNRGKNLTSSVINMNSQKYKRWQYHTILNTLKTRRVIILAGARQTGKTTLVKQLTEEKCLRKKNLNKTTSNSIIYRSLDDVTLLEAALSDPHGFVAHDEHLMIIDEVQRAPILLQAIKQDVDINTKKVDSF